MKKLLFVIVGIVILIIIGVMIYANTYNSIIKKDENVNAKFGNVQAQYQRRADLIPNLVKIVSEYASYEKETLTAVTNARASATQAKVNINDPKSFQTFQKAQGELSGALSRLLVVVEKYPDLKANQNFLNLQDELAGTENRINRARLDYNDSVKDYNTTVRSFFTSMFFGSKFQVREVFEASAGAEKAPDIKFNRK